MSTHLMTRPREKQIKSGSRARKLKLITIMNPEWRDLYEDNRLPA